MSEEKRAELERIDAAIAQTRQQMETQYAEIGRRCFAQMKKEPPEQLAEPVAALGALHEQLARQQDERDRVRGFTACPACGADVPYGSRFCNHCGVRLEEAAPVEEPPAAPEPPRCRYCGEPLEAGSRFCIYCGREQP